MKELIHKITTRHLKTGFDGKEQINHQRRTAMIMIITGLSRVLIWLALIIMYLLGVRFTKSLFQSVAFVALISLYANAATDWGQVAASLAQLTAGDAHHDAEATRREVGFDVVAIESDLEKLAKLNPGPEAIKLSEEIKLQIMGNK